MALLSNLPTDVVRLILLNLDWQTIVKLKRINKRFGSIIDEQFWKHKLYYHFTNPVLTYNNDFCNLLLNQITANKSTSISNILAKYLRNTFPTSFNYHYLSRYISGQSSPRGGEEILEHIDTTKVDKYDVIIADITCHFAIHDTEEEFESHYTMMTFVNDNVENIDIFCQDYKENGKDYKYDISSKFLNFINKYGLDLNSANWLYFGSAEYKFI